MRKYRLSYRETVRKRLENSKEKEPNHKKVQRKKRIYLKEGVEGLIKEKTVRPTSFTGARKGSQPKRQKYPLKDLLQLPGHARSTLYYHLKHRNNV